MTGITSTNSKWAEENYFERKKILKQRIILWKSINQSENFSSKRKKNLVKLMIVEMKKKMKNFFSFCAQSMIEKPPSFCHSFICLWCKFVFLFLWVNFFFNHDVWRPLTASINKIKSDATENVAGKTSCRNKSRDVERGII